MLVPGRVPIFLFSDDAKKKEPVLGIAGIMSKVYFHLNTLQFCKNLINAVDRLDFNNLPSYSRVTHRTLSGKLSPMAAM